MLRYVFFGPDCQGLIKSQQVKVQVGVLQWEAYTTR